MASSRLTKKQLAAIEAIRFNEQQHRKTRQRRRRYIVQVQVAGLYAIGGLLLDAAQSKRRCTPAVRAPRTRS